VALIREPHGRGDPGDRLDQSSLVLDVKILLRTLPVVLLARGAA